MRVLLFTCISLFLVDDIVVTSSLLLTDVRLKPCSLLVMSLVVALIGLGGVNLVFYEFLLNLLLLSLCYLTQSPIRSWSHYRCCGTSASWCLFFDHLLKLVQFLAQLRAPMLLAKVTVFLGRSFLWDSGRSVSTRSLCNFFLAV